jgi:hypothetical protein
MYSFTFASLPESVCTANHWAPGGLEISVAMVEGWFVAARELN